MINNVTGHADEAPRYVKNILARLRELPLHDREVWLKAIMGEFEQDFSHAKWREGYEQGKFEGAWVVNQLKDADKIRQELNKSVIPKFVADFITEQKKLGHTLSYSIDACMSDIVAEWSWDNSELFALAWIFGYKVEKEKRYLVKLKGLCRNEERMKIQSKCIKIPAKIRPFDVGYRVVNKHGQPLALKNGASIFTLPSLAEKAIKKEFGKNDPDFDTGKHFIEEVAIINLSEFHSYFEEVE